MDLSKVKQRFSKANHRLKKITKKIIILIASILLGGLLITLFLVPTSSLTIEADCENEGHSYEVNFFGYKRLIDSTPALGHQLQPIGEYIKPTCISEGKTTGSQCIRCGKIIDEIKSLPIAEHSFLSGECTHCGAKYDKEVESIEFLCNGEIIDSIDFQYMGDDVQVELKINGENYEYLTSPFSVNWTFQENDIDAIVENGTIHINQILGTIHLNVIVQGSNSQVASIPINIIANDNMKLLSLEALSKSSFHKYIEGESFNPDNVNVLGTYEIEGKNEKIQIMGYEYDKKALTTGISDIEISYMEKSIAYPILVSPKSLQSITIVKKPSVTSYTEGQYFDKTGLSIKANYEFISEVITDYKIEKDSYLKETDTFVRISYTYNGVTKFVDQPIKVGTKKLLSLTVDDTNVQKQYTVGDSFNPDGLVVKANFEYIGEMEITDYKFSSESLTKNTKDVVISYSAGQCTVTKKINVIVTQPYQQLCNIKVITSPADVEILWVYRYYENGEEVIDNTSFEDRSLQFDQINGLYQVPVGSVVTVSIRNPAKIGILLNDQPQNIDYEEKSISFKVKSSDDINISLSEMAGRHSVIRFYGENKNQFFLYDGNWNGKLTEDNLLRLNEIFNNNDNYYYTYLINSKTLTYDDLYSKNFFTGMEIPVAKNTVQDNAKEVILHLHDGISYSMRIPEEEADTWIIPSFVCYGYYFQGWAVDGKSSALSQDEIIALLKSEATNIDLYVVWKEEIVNYSFYLHHADNITILSPNKIDEGDISLMGNWNGSFTDDEENDVECCLVFSADGSFEYSLKWNKTLNTQYSGKYRISESNIYIIYSEPNISDIPYLNASDFGITINENGLCCNLIMIDNEGINISSCKMNK